MTIFCASAPHVQAGAFALQFQLSFSAAPFKACKKQVSLACAAKALLYACSLSKYLHIGCAATAWSPKILKISR
jgi:hypothetical protein